MIASNKLCKICKCTSQPVLGPKEEVIGVKLLTIIQKFGHKKASQLSPNFLCCVSCALGLRQADFMVSRLEQVLMADEVGQGEHQSAKAIQPSEEVNIQGNESDKSDNDKKDRDNPKKSDLSAITRNWPFQCKLCDYSTKSRLVFKKHLLSKHQDDDQRIYKCPYCSESYQRLNGIQNHIAYVHEHRPKPLRKRRRSTTSYTLNGTGAQQDENQISDKMEADSVCNVAEDCSNADYIFECDKCLYKTTNPKLFRKHLVEEHNDNDMRIYKCPTCSYAYQRVHYLQNHIAYVHENKPRTISQRRKSVSAEFTLNSTTELKDHDAVKVDHHNDTNICDLCSYKAKDEFTLRKHSVLVHQIDSITEQNEESKDHSTEDESFYENSKLPKHLHSNEKKMDTLFCCEYCSYETTKKKSFRRHLFAEHKIENAKIYKCSQCNEYFAHQSILRKHFSHAHQYEFPVQKDGELESESNFGITKNLSNKKSKRKRSIESIDSSPVREKNWSRSFEESVETTPLQTAKKQKHKSFTPEKLFSPTEKLSSAARKGPTTEKMKICGNCAAQFYSKEKYDAHIFGEKCLNKKLPCQISSCNKRFSSISKLNLHMTSKHAMFDSPHKK